MEIDRFVEMIDLVVYIDRDVCECVCVHTSNKECRWVEDSDRGWNGTGALDLNQERIGNPTNLE